MRSDNQQRSRIINAKGRLKTRTTGAKREKGLLWSWEAEMNEPETEYWIRQFRDPSREHCQLRRGRGQGTRLHEVME